LLQNPLQKQQTGAGPWPKPLRSAGFRPEITAETALFGTQ
jgi:hypothetical protein